MLLTEYNEEETMAMFKRDYEADLAKVKAELRAEVEEAKAKAADAEAKLAAANALIAELQKKKA